MFQGVWQWKVDCKGMNKPDRPDFSPWERSSLACRWAGGYLAANREEIGQKQRRTWRPTGRNVCRCEMTAFGRTSVSASTCDAVRPTLRWWASYRRRWRRTAQRWRAWTPTTAVRTPRSSAQTTPHRATETRRILTDEPVSRHSLRGFTLSRGNPAPATFLKRKFDNWH